MRDGKRRNMWLEEKYWFWLDWPSWPPPHLQRESELSHTTTLTDTEKKTFITIHINPIVLLHQFPLISSVSDFSVPQFQLQQHQLLVNSIPTFSLSVLWGMIPMYDSLYHNVILHHQINAPNTNTNRERKNQRKKESPPAGRHPHSQRRQWDGEERGPTLPPPARFGGHPHRWISRWLVSEGRYALQTQSVWCCCCHFYSEGEEEEVRQRRSRRRVTCPYPWGVDSDWAWGGSRSQRPWWGCWTLRCLGPLALLPSAPISHMPIP